MNVTRIMALDKVTKGFDYRDEKALEARTAELNTEIKIKHIEALFKQVGFCDLNQKALHLMLNNTDFQEMASKFLWDSMLIAAKYERAMMIDGHEEAA
ncbi:hypothetical protein [Yersinia enterocolitica]|uniref:hypothetical protein n=1 Tax=Yersinia enterocolitica TaxID=630 RepID=UPI003D043B28|nr:hypothetical protein [Yersinia enterocolitica]EKN5088592.1 hypothetical protein [Yersinia enterocolitica]EKN6092531.1 hypothetical protein [Yersinia enterocolitica]EKN6369531.1 hypothetical protein [Yersinia enterocolitica]